MLRDEGWMLWWDAKGKPAEIFNVIKCLVELRWKNKSYVQFTCTIHLLKEVFFDICKITLVLVLIKKLE